MLSSPKEKFVSKYFFDVRNDDVIFIESFSKIGCVIVIIESLVLTLKQQQEEPQPKSF